jgi:hypothetical protein
LAHFLDSLVGSEPPLLKFPNAFAFIDLTERIRLAVLIRFNSVRRSSSGSNSTPHSVRPPNRDEARGVGSAFSKHGRPAIGTYRDQHLGARPKLSATPNQAQDRTASGRQGEAASGASPFVAAPG